MFHYSDYFLSLSKFTSILDFVNFQSLPFVWLLQKNYKKILISCFVTKLKNQQMQMVNKQCIIEEL
jgi:hypothetical protein